MTSNAEKDSFIEKLSIQSKPKYTQVPRNMPIPVAHCISKKPLETCQKSKIHEAIL